MSGRKYHWLWGPLAAVFRPRRAGKTVQANKLRVYPRVEELEVRRLLTISNFQMANPISVVEGHPIVPNQLATFTSTDMNLGDFSVSVDWGGPVPSPAGAAVSGGGGTYQVIGDAAYTDEGNFTLSLTVTEADDGSKASGSLAATISDAALTAGGLSIPSVNEGQTGRVTFTFSDANMYASASDFSGSINWGDGTTTSGLAVTSAFQVQASHVYTEEVTNGTVTATATEDAPSNASVSQSGTINVGDPNVQLTGAGPFTSTEGTSTGTLTLGTFTDPGGAEVAADYGVTVNWGDGNSSTVTPTLNGSTFTIASSHTYTDDNTGNGEAGFNITVSVSHETSATQQVTDTINVLEPTVQFAQPIYYTTEPTSGTAASSPITVKLLSLSDDAVTVDYTTIECG